MNFWRDLTVTHPSSFFFFPLNGGYVSERKVLCRRKDQGRWNTSCPSDLKEENPQDIYFGFTLRTQNISTELTSDPTGRGSSATSLPP